MTVQGLMTGWDAHRFRAFDRDAVATEFAVPDHLEVTSMTAFGVAAHGPQEVISAGTSRERLTCSSTTWERC